MGEDRAEVAADLARDEAVAERHPPVGAGPGQDAAGRLEPEVLQRLVESPFPTGRLGLRLGQRAATRRQLPSIVTFDRRAVRALEAVLRIPDLPRHRGEAVGHAGERSGKVSVHLVSNLTRPAQFDMPRDIRGRSPGASLSNYQRRL